MASLFRSVVPEVATMTGSTTSGMCDLEASISTTATRWAFEYSIPVLMASTGYVLRRISTCSWRMVDGTGWMDSTDSGVSATTQLSAVRPCVPSLENVLRSAWIPAPDEQSDPAMVRVIGGFMVWCGGYGFWK